MNETIQAILNALYLDGITLHANNPGGATDEVQAETREAAIRVAYDALINETPYIFETYKRIVARQ